ncbi:hypothetical protein I6E91_25700 [Enterocloster clostridioformis]|uniref:hypothetical protein n=1 Tax=Enterocloster clostridioformis TaxID=1531 RepID=UPI001F161A9A|nr:hypothetical protein [Enterocloster clostridioformis]MCF2705351.1 hypothetical protein [Enterocloster clostridioformis]
MKKITVLVLIMCLIIFMAGCNKHCKIEGCKNEVYKEGLCQKHYYINQGADAIDSAVNGILDIIK